MADVEYAGGAALIIECEQRGLDRHDMRADLLGYLAAPLTADDLATLDTLAADDRVPWLMARYGDPALSPAQQLALVARAEQPAGVLAADLVYALHSGAEVDVLLSPGTWVRSVEVSGRAPRVGVVLTCSSPQVPERSFSTRMWLQSVPSEAVLAEAFPGVEASAVWETLLSGLWPVASPPPG